MSGKSEKRWIVRDSDGKIYGPFTTDQLLAQIDKSYFLGTEQVATYPGGSWVPISKSREFSDRLLDALDAEIRSAEPARPSTARSTTPEPEPDEVTPQDPILTGSTGSSRKSLQVSGESTTPFASGTHLRSGSGPVIELTDLKSVERKERLREGLESSKLPLIIIGLAVVLAVMALFSSGGPTSDGNRIRLLLPKKGQSRLSDAKLKEKFKRALDLIVTDTFSGYQGAQNELVEIIEGSSPKPEDAAKKASALSTLCMVYRELWPFAVQDSRDLKVVSLVMQETKRIDPAGLNGAICEITNLMVTGRHREAQGLTESMLLEESQAPVLYEIRGDLYMYYKDNNSAVDYFNKSRTLWPAWQKTFVQEARARMDLKQFPAAIQLYREVIRRSPEHGVAKIKLGLIEGLEFNQHDKGIELIKAGLDASDRVTKQTESEGYFGMAQIHLRKNQRARALEFAKKAYDLDSSNFQAKDMVMSLAGEGAVQNTKHDASELIYLGDQYVRAGDCFSAQAQFKAAYEVNNKNGMAAMKAGKCLWQLNQTSEAIEWMKKAILADPDLIAAYVELADYHAQRFDFFSAAEILKRAQQKQPKSFEVYRGFATVELRRNNFQGAVTFGNQALKLYETDMDTILLMAKAHLGLQNYQDAQRFASKAIELDASHLEAHSLFAKIEAGLHGVEAGAAYISQMLGRFVIIKGQQVPQAAIDYRVTLGEIYVQDEKYKPAEDAFRQAISLDPNHKRALINLGKILQAQNLHQQALEYYLKAAVLDPSDADPIFFSGQLYAETNRLEDATRQFERVLKINPRYPKAHVNLGQMALRKSNPQAALESAMQERTINPDLSDAYVLAAEAYFALRQYSNCAAEYQRAVSKKGQGATTLVKMARCYRLAGALDSAGSLLRQAVQVESGNPDIYKEQGAVFHTKGMADEAVTQYDTYLRLAPNAADRAEVENRIRKVLTGDLTVGD
jgi:tetratricopeptide (TPR) repeat protein